MAARNSTVRNMLALFLGFMSAACSDDLSGVDMETRCRELYWRFRSEIEDVLRDEVVDAILDDLQVGSKHDLFQDLSRRKEFKLSRSEIQERVLCELILETWDYCVQECYGELLESMESVPQALLERTIFAHSLKGAVAQMQPQYESADAVSSLREAVRTVLDLEHFAKFEQYTRMRVVHQEAGLIERMLIDADISNVLTVQSRERIARVLGEERAGVWLALSDEPKLKWQEELRRADKRALDSVSSDITLEELAFLEIILETWNGDTYTESLTDISAYSDNH